MSQPAALAVALLGSWFPTGSKAQISPGQAAAGQSLVGARVDALLILGGDFGFSDGSFHSQIPQDLGPSGDVSMDVSKIGGDGDVGDPRPLGHTGIGWQPRFQGSMGYVESTIHELSPLLQGDSTRLRSTSVEFGGGARLWTSENLSFAPTVMLMYGHTTSDYTARSDFAQANLGELRELGLIDWSVNTLSVRPALNVQYIVPLDRARITLSMDGAAFVTRSLGTSSDRVDASGTSGFLTAKIDLDVPLGVALDGHELRGGGYLSRSELFGQLRTGLGVQYLNEIHGRLVFDFLSQVWKVQWLGVGASYVWGPNFSGWTWGADVTFRF